MRLVIDGRQVTVSGAVTVLDACRAAGVWVPTLCADPDLTPWGACRLCLVKIDGLRGLPAACTTIAADGMNIVTDDDELRAVRAITVQLLLSDHPQDCLTCPRNGRCALQDIAARLGIRERLFRTLDRPARRDDSNPCFTFDPAKCVLCGKCVRACAELNGCAAIDFLGRGFETQIAPFAGGSFRESVCESCGECVEHCPTGALAPRRFLPPEREAFTVCPYCGAGCRIVFGVRGNRLVAARGDRDGPVNRGRLCVKGRFGSFEFVGSAERLRKPLVRDGERLREATWDEALAAAAQGLARHRGDAFGGLASAKIPNEDNYVFQQFVRATMRTNNVDHCARLCHASTVAGLALAFGSAAMTNPAADLLLADTILVTGSNTTETHPVIGFLIRRAVERGAKLLVFDPRRIALTRIATLWCRPRPGTDVAWINGLLHVILRENLHDAEFVAERTEGLAALRAVIERYAPERVAALTGIPAGDLVAAARLYAAAERAAIVYAMGITQHTTGVDNVRSLANLAMLTGNVGKPGAGVYPLRGQNNVQGACDMGALPDMLPGYQPVADGTVRAKFEKAWGTSLSAEPGLTATEMIPAAATGQVKALYIVGENPLLSDADTRSVERCLRALDFLVVQDIFLTETARLAHVVFPALTFAERDGTYTNTERRVQLAHPVVAPPDGPRRDWEIFCDLSTRLGRPMSYASSREIWDEMRMLTPSYAGISRARLEAGESLCWPCPDEQHPGTPVLHVGKFARGKGAFAAIEFTPPAEEPDDEYPFRLTTGRVLEQYHTGTMSRRSPALEALAPECFVELSASDAARLHLRDGAPVRVVTRRGAVDVRARLGNRVGPGTLFMPFHYAEARANELTNPARDPRAKIPEFKVCAARLEPLRRRASARKANRRHR